jgi:hypothetical protein
VGRIEEIRERSEKATEGPWRVDAGANTEEPRSCCFMVREVDARLERELDNEHEPEDIEDSAGYDALFIAHARDDVPFLLTKLDEAVGIIRAHHCVLVDGGGCATCAFLAGIEGGGE